MFSFGSHSVITGGTFTQVNHRLQEQLQTPWDRLQSAVAPAAFHNSAERFDPPRCHPNTRVAVVNELRDLALQSQDSTGSVRMLWLRGPAGAGKSAIAQTLCDDCYSTNSLLASFFFNRFDPSRNKSKSLVATLTYQIYGKVPAEHQSRILSVIENDPLVFERSIEAQFKALITDPLRDLFEAVYFGKYAPSLIVVDGLDECSNPQIQVSILSALEKISMQSNSPFVFLIASRPEHDIQMFFRSSTLGRLLHQLNLDGSYRPDVDIQRFLKEKIQETCTVHPLKDYIPREWPSDKVIQDIVQKSSGQFIYASVVVKYVTSNRHYPPSRLDVVLHLLPPKHDLPFAELDALYSHIFSCIENVTLVLRILCVVMLFQEGNIDIFIEDVEQLCELGQGECFGALCDLQSVIQVESTPQKSIRILHKSLPDYLQDPLRSQKYHIDTSARVVILIAVQCFRYVSDLTINHNLRYLSFILEHLSVLLSNIQLCHEHLISFSLTNCRKTTHGSISNHELLTFAFIFLDKLCILQGTSYEHVYHHHLHQFPKLVEQYPEVYGPSFPLANEDFVFPMIFIFVLLEDSDINISPQVFDFLQKLPFKTLNQVPLDYEHTVWLENLPCLAAHRCINSLLHDNRHMFTAFALEFLALILSECRLSPELNKACHPDSPFATVGDHGLSRLTQGAHAAMRAYRERYANEQLSE